MDYKLLHTAKTIAYKAHAGQKRNFADIPYITHPENVANLAHKYNLSDELIAAAWLHDVIEDCDPKYGKMILNKCGGKVYNLVNELTNPTSKMPKEQVEMMSRQRKFYINFPHIINISNEAKIIKTLDITDNLSSYKQSPVKWLKKYVAEKELIISHDNFQNPYTRMLNNLEDLMYEIKCYLGYFAPAS